MQVMILSLRFLHEPDQTGRAKLAVKFGITTSQAHIAQVNIVFRAHICRLAIGVIDAFTHSVEPSFQPMNKDGKARVNPFQREYHPFELSPSLC